MSSAAKKEWIYSPAFDLAFILGPSFLVTLAVVLIPGFSAATSDVPLWAWVVFVMGIDVAHVYSTLFRTYLDYEERGKRNLHFTLIPLLCWIGGAVLYSFGSHVFWRTLAYIAVYHFVRQQYGFMMIYVRKGVEQGKKALLLDKAAIYLATLYPLIYWHTHDRTFHWFVEGDFISLGSTTLATFTGWVYAAVLALYVIKESAAIRSGAKFNTGKNLLLLGTALSWYVGIVLYNGDMAFTLTNVVSHGIPYIALVWIYSQVKWSKVARQAGDDVRASRLSGFFQPRWAPVYLAVLLLMAYFEEGLWDTFVWRERAEFFLGWLSLPKIDSEATLTWLVPLLVVPQATHYILDAFIWRIRKPDAAFEYLVVKEPAAR